MATETQVVQQAYRFALDPTPTQARMFASHAGAARFAYNWGNARIIAALDARQAQKDAGEAPSAKVPSHFDLCKEWVVWKNEHLNDPEPGNGQRATCTRWVGENFSGTYQAALRDAAKAWGDFFKTVKGERAGRGVRRPKFKKKGRARDSFQVHGGTLRMLDAAHVTLPKIGTVAVMSDDSRHPVMVRSRTRGASHGSRARHMGNRRRARMLVRGLRRDETARIIRATLTRGADGLWWCSVTAAVPIPVRTAPSRAQRQGGMIGVDFGVRDIATCSNGDVITNPRYLRDALAELRVAQKALSRSQPGSKRYGKTKTRAGLIHADVARLRSDALHRATTNLVRHHDVIAVEGWDVQQVMGDGSKSVPRRVRRVRNRALADTGIGFTRQMLSYKGPRVAATVLVAGKQAQTGRTCHVDSRARTTPLPPHVELFTSDQCGHVLDRRLNTARVLAAWAALELKRGLPCGGPVEFRGGDVRPAAGREVGGGRFPVKRVTSSRRVRGDTGTPGG